MILTDRVILFFFFIARGVRYFFASGGDERSKYLPNITTFKLISDTRKYADSKLLSMTYFHEYFNLLLYLTRFICKFILRLDYYRYSLYYLYKYIYRNYFKEPTYKGAIYCIPRRPWRPIDLRPGASTNRPVQTCTCVYIIYNKKIIYT